MDIQIARIVTASVLFAYVVGGVVLCMVNGRLPPLSVLLQAYGLTTAVVLLAYAFALCIVSVLDV